MNNQLNSSITLHDALHIFRQGRGTGTKTFENKLSPQLAGLCYDPLLQFLLDVCKYYDALDWGKYMEILRGYGLGSNLQNLLQCFWDYYAVITKAGRFYGKYFRTERVVTQG